MVSGVRFIYRPSAHVFEKLSRDAELKGISLNSEINSILGSYYDYKDSYPEFSVWGFMDDEKPNKIGRKDNHHES